MNIFQRPTAKRADDEAFDFAISFSDLMTGLVMLFIFVLMGVLYTRGKQLEHKESQLAVAQNRLKNVEVEVKAMLGVRAELVALLRKKFSGIEERVDVDPKTGALRIGEAILFDYESATLKPTGRQVVDRVYRKLASVLFGSDFPHRRNLASIAIEGHASREPLRDRTEARVARDYLLNLELSQRRAQAVLAYLSTLKGVDQDQLRTYAVAVGYGHSRLRGIDRPESSENRRIEITFRLKDEEALEKMKSMLTRAGDGAGK